MAKEEVFIPEMEKLEIEPLKVTSVNHDKNPFKPRMATRRLAAAHCGCNKKSIKNTITFKRSSHKMLKEPILKLEGKAVLSAVKPTIPLPDYHKSPSRCPLQTLNLETLNMCTLVDNVPLSSSLPLDSPSFSELQRSQSRDAIVTAGAGSGERSRSAGPSCSQQALNPQCDITIDELASYFETLVHIPKKMSTMAEMMYI